MLLVGVLLRLPADVLERIDERVQELRKRPYEGMLPSRANLLRALLEAAVDLYLAQPLPSVPPDAPREETRAERHARVFAKEKARLVKLLEEDAAARKAPTIAARTPRKTKRDKLPDAD